MRILIWIALLLLLSGCTPQSHRNNLSSEVSVGVVYESDSREPLKKWSFEAKHIAPAIATLVPSQRLIPHPTNSKIYSLRARSLMNQMRLCPEVKFAQETALGICTAFLINDRFVMTAKHCVQDFPDACKKLNIVFDWFKQSDKISIESVYKCKRVIQDEDIDVALIELDRPAMARAPLRLAKSSMQNDEDYTIASHPVGIPLKVSKAQVRQLVFEKNSWMSVLEADTFSGDSGAPVLKSQTNQVQGMVLSGENDFVINEARGCREINVCDKGKCAGEKILNFQSPEFKDFLDFASRQK